MRRTIAYLLAGIVLLALGCIWDGAWWLCAWPAANLLLMAGAYAGLGAGLLGKRSDGSMALPAVILLLPLLAATWTLWHLRRRLTRRPCCHQVAPGLWIGRRPLDGDLPAGVATIVDLTAEFPESKTVLADRQYLCLPTLDGSVPGEAPFRRLLNHLGQDRGGIYVHCAAGRGRAALVAAALLVRRHLASDLAEAIAKLENARPGVRLNRKQFQFLRQVLKASGDLPEARTG